MIPVGIQLYGLRQPAVQDWRGTIQSIRSMGYEGIEWMEGWSFPGMSPPALADLMKRVGLKMPGIYSSVESLLNPNHPVYAFARHFACEWVTVGLPQLVTQNWAEAVRLVTQAAEQAQKCGLQLLYHNHALEFARLDGRCALDILLDETSPDLVGLELDTYFTLQEGLDPIEWIRRRGNRLGALHLKDMNARTKGVIELGQGCLDIRGVLAAVADTKARWLVVEFHDIPGRSPLDSARICSDYLKTAWGHT